MAQPKYDMELFLTDVKSMIIDNLNTKITAVNNEKNTVTNETNDNFNINDIQDDAVYFAQMPDVYSYKQFVIYGLQDLSITESMSVDVIQKISVFIEVVLPDEGQPSNEAQIYKLLRYMRSLQEVAIENYDKFRGYSKLAISSLPPTILEHKGKTLKSAGIVVSASINIS